MVSRVQNHSSNHPPSTWQFIWRELYRPLRRWLLLRYRLDDAEFQKFPDRQWLNQKLFPQLAKLEQGHILYVGCAFYTWRSLRYFQKSIDLLTVDIDPDNAIWGGKKHLAANILEIDQHVALYSFDIVLLNGVFGHGVNSPEDQEKAYRALHQVLKPDGLLLVGWNNDLGPDPITLPAREKLFYRTQYADLPERTTFPNSTHVFDFLRARTTS